MNFLGHFRLTPSMYVLQRSDVDLSIGPCYNSKIQLISFHDEGAARDLRMKTASTHSNPS